MHRIQKLNMWPVKPKGPPDEDSTADYWVVESDRATRIHITPRYWLFTPSAESCPVPLDYMDVLRFLQRLM